MFEVKDKKYFGSALSFIQRIIEHRHEINKKSLSTSVFYKTVKEDIIEKNTRFSIIHKIPNFKFIFQLEHPDFNLSAGHIQILEAFSLFSIRTLEQLLIDAFPKNSLNSRKVYHNYT